MTDKQTRPEGQEFSRELLQAIAADEISCYIDLPVLAGDDVAALKQILLGKRVPRIPIDMKRAVTALAHSESSAEASEILGRVMADTKETMRVRAAAAANLSLMPQEAAEDALLRNLTADNDILRVEVFKSLARVGTVKSLERLKSLPEPETEHVRSQLSLAKVAISFRSGSDARDGQDANSALGIRWTTHTAKMLEGKQVRETIAAISGPTYGITLNLETCFEISCGGRTNHFLFMNDAIKRGAYIESMRSRNMIAGLVALSEKETRHLTIRYLVLTSPSEKGVEVIVTRTNGDVAYTGEARPADDGFQLTMRDVGSERMATEIEGYASDADIQLRLRVWRGRVKPKRHGEPIGSDVLERVPPIRR